MNQALPAIEIIAFGPLGVARAGWQLPPALVFSGVAWRLQPLAPHQKLLHQCGLGRAWFGRALVRPRHQRRHGQQDRFGAPPRLQAEVRTPVPHQIELDIAAPAVQLEVAFAIALRRGLAALNDGQVCAQKGIAHRLRHGQALPKAQL